MPPQDVVERRRVVPRRRRGLFGDPLQPNHLVHPPDRERSHSSRSATPRRIRCRPANRTPGRGQEELREFGFRDRAAALPVRVGVGVPGQAEQRGAVGADREPELGVEGRVEACQRFGVGLVECVLEPGAVTGAQPAPVHVVIDEPDCLDVLAQRRHSHAPGEAELLGELLGIQVAVVLLLVAPHRDDGVDHLVAENASQQRGSVERVDRLRLIRRQQRRCLPRCVGVSLRLGGIDGDLLGGSDSARSMPSRARPRIAADARYGLADGSIDLDLDVGAVRVGRARRAGNAPRPPGSRCPSRCGRPTRNRAACAAPTGSTRTARPGRRAARRALRPTADAPSAVIPPGPVAAGEQRGVAAGEREVLMGTGTDASGERHRRQARPASRIAGPPGRR